MTAWPVIFLYIIIIFRKEIHNLLPDLAERLEKASIGDSTLEFSINENKEEFEKIGKGIFQDINDPKREEKTKDKLEKIFILGYESGKGKGPYNIDNVKIRRDARGNIETIQYDEI